MLGAVNAGTTHVSARVMTDAERREQMAILIAGRMAMHWPLRCPMCPDQTAMALDITDAILAMEQES